MRSRIALMLIAMLIAGPAAAAERIDVMTQNQYIGTDLAPVLTAPPEEFNDALVASLQQVAAARFEERAGRLAALIARRMPHLVGLQEVFQFGCVDLTPVPIPDAGCRDPSIAGAFVDHLSETLDALDALGAGYYVAARVRNLDLGKLSLPTLPPGLPFVINGVPAVLTVIDRDVILARDDVPAWPVGYQQLPGVCPRPSLEGCNYQAVVEVTGPGGVIIPVERGFVGVDAEVAGRTYRFVTTHLEIVDPLQPLSSFYQSAQALELLGVLGVTTPPDVSLLVAGDFNSWPEQQSIPGPLPLPPPLDQGIVPPYALFTGSGFIDVWTLRPGEAAGDTCCQLVDLSNHRSELLERIDHIFTFDMPRKVKQARVLGGRVADKTSPPGQGLWPSDHGSVAAGLVFD